MKENLDEGGRFAVPTLPPAMQPRLGACTEAERTELETTWHLAGLGKEAEVAPSTDAAWARLLDTLDNGRPVGAPRKLRPERGSHRRRRGRWRWGMVGLTVVAVVGMALAFWRQPVTIHAPRGSTVAVTLPDGSQAELNSGSALAYERRLFGWTRTLRLDGEAFFEVVRAEEPFVVETFNAAVAVLGTRFNVRAWPDDDQPETVVVLQSGAVELVSRTGRARAVRLEPGQLSRLPLGAGQPSQPEAVSVDRLLAWRSGGLVFNNQPLGVILSEVERRFGVEIRTRPRSIEHDSLVLFLARPPNAEAVLEAICRFRGYRYRATDDGYAIMKE